MAIQFPTLQRRTLDRRMLLAGAAALAFVAYIPMSQIGAPDYSDLAANQFVEMHAARLPVADLTELTKKSDAVVVGKVVGSSPVRFVQTENQAPLPLQADSRLAGIGKSKDAAAFSAPKRSNDGILTPPKGI